MLGPELSSHNNDSGLYNFNKKEYGQAFFLLDDIDMPFPKPPDDDDDNDSGLLVASTGTGVRILQIQYNPGGSPRDNNYVDAAAVDR